MQALTLIVDHHINDIYFSALKYHIQNKLPDFYIFEYIISRELSEKEWSTDKIYKAAAYLLINAHQFPSNYIYYIEVNAPKKEPSQKILLIQYNEQWILTPDNGILGLIDQYQIQNVFHWYQPIQSSFYAKKEMLDALVYLVSHQFIPAEKFISTSLNQCKQYVWPSPEEKILPNQKKIIKLPVLLVDTFGNIILHLKKQEFEKLKEQYDVTIRLPHSSIQDIHHTYNDVDNNHEIAIFNEAGYLELAINDNNFALMIGDRNIYDATSYNIHLFLTPKKSSEL